MRILHIVRNLEIGGMERFVVELSAEQAASGCVVGICEVCASSVTRMIVPQGVEHYAYSGTKSICGNFHQVWRAIKMFNPDLIHSHNTLALQQSVLPCLCSGKPMVMTKHGMDFSRGVRGLFYIWPRHTICVSKPIRQQMILLHPSLSQRSSVIHNGIKLSAGSESLRYRQRKLLGLDADVRAFVWVGRFVAAKAIDVMIRAFADHGHSPRWKLFMIGDGCLRASVERQVAQLGMEARVVFLGMRQDVRELLAAFDVFILPSISEGLPIALLEAADAGLPLIVSSVGDMPDVVCKQNGWVVPPGDEKSLTACLRVACNMADKDLREMGVRSKSVAAEKFAISMCAEHYRSVYAQVVCRSGANIVRHE